MSYYGSGAGGGGSGGGGFYGQQQHHQQPPYGNQQQPPNFQQQQQQQGGFQSGYGDSNSGWQQQQYPQQQQYQQQQSQQYNNNSNPMQQQSQQQATSFFNPALAATMATAAMSGGGLNNDVVSNIAMKGAKDIYDIGVARMIPGMEYTMVSLRSYFAVDNRYVLQKMKRVLLPFLSDRQGWARQVREPATHDRAAVMELPSLDECAPDLYLPVMSLITYVLLSALCYGTAGEFNPEVLPDVASKCAIYQTLEVAIIRGGFYAMQVPVSFLDLFSYTGYKYLGLCINMIVGIIVGHFGLFGSTGYYACFLWTASAAAYFMLKTMSNNIPLQTAPTGPKREVVVLGFAGLQFFTMWMVSQTKFL